MSRLVQDVKKTVEKHSESLSFLRYIPYRIRLGQVYSEHEKLIRWYQDATVKEREKFHFEKLNAIMNYAFENIKFYREQYNSHRYSPASFKTLDHFADVPIICKDDLRSYTLENRSSKSRGAMKINTGGTSGNPLGFYIDKNTFAREWAYMHHIWGKLQYSYLDTKLTFRGKNLGDKAVQYNVVHNEYYVNPYLGFGRVINEIKALAGRKVLKFLHGYPSAIYEFCKFLQVENIDADDLFNGNLQGVFLGSEYPAPVYRELIEDVLNVSTLSWYGHSEFSILAVEVQPFIYAPFPTYGFAEADQTKNKSEYRLLATSYYNTASPFIRYDTGDLIKSPVFDHGILERFQIASGRIGDFITDIKGNQISLTALIFGRHHEAFEKADFIQIRNPVPGKATLVVTTKDSISLEDFDLTNVAIDFELEIINNPVRTETGKLPLLID